MVNTRRCLLVFLLLIVTTVLPAAAEVFTVKLVSGAEFITRYEPRQDPRHENKVGLLTEFGNWIALTKDSIAQITADTETRGFGTVLDTSTIIIGWAPNDKPAPGKPPSDPTSQLLDYLRSRDQPAQDFSVQQFVDSDNAGLGGLPASGVSSSGSSSFPVAVGGTIAAEPQTIDQ